MLNRIMLRLRGSLARFIADERGSATEYIMIAGLAVIVLGAAVVTWNEGLVTYLEEMLTDLQGWESNVRRILISEHGGAATEAILVLSLLAPLFAAMIALGDLWADQVALDHVAAVTVRRAAAAGGDSAQLRASLRSDLEAAGLPAESVTVRVDPAAPSWQGSITVRLSLARSIQIPLLGIRDLQLSSQFSARNEVGEVAA